MARITWINAEGGEEIPAGRFALTLSNGFEPGKGEMQFDSRWFCQLGAKGEVRITVNFENSLAPTTLTIKDLFVESFTRKTALSGDSIYTAHLVDKRFLWQKFGEITLFANYLRPDGTYEKGSLCGTRPYTWREIVLLCIAAMGETENLLNADALPENPYPLTNIDWHSKNPAAALREILDATDYTVALHYDGKISLVKRNESTLQTLPSGYGPTRECGNLFADVPESVVVLGGPVVNQVSVELEPCALDTDGKIKGLDEVSYLRGKDVGLELATGFASLAKEPEAQSAARATVGHLWRIPNTGFFADDTNDANRFLLPVLDATCEKAGEGEFLTPKLHGANFEKGTKSGYENFGGEGEKRVPFPKGWAVIDRRRGLVKTQKVSGTLTETDIDALPQKKDGKSTKVTLVPVSLTFAHYAVEANGSVKVFRYKQAEGARVCVVNRPEMRIRTIEGRPVEPLYSQTIARCAQIASEILSRTSEAQVEFGTYAGVHPLRASGTITSITWTADSKSGYTHYTYDNADNSKAAPFTGAVESTTPINGVALEGSQVEIAPTDEELRIINANKRGPIIIKGSQELKKKLIEEKRRGDTETNLFAELSNFDEEHQEPELSKIAPPEELNWSHREHTGSTNPEPDSQDKVWAVQLISDDKYAIETALNRSTEVLRTCDENKGDLDDIWRVRAIPGAEDVAADLPQRDNETRVKIISKEELYRLMWLINKVIGGEGGWITDVPPEGLALGARSDEKSVSPPRMIGQIGNIVILTADDEICLTKDGDTFTYANIRHDAHFHKTPEKDGRIHFSNDPPGARPQGTWVVGKMVCDPALKNQDTELGKESGQWCPQVPIPVTLYERWSIDWFPLPDIAYPTAREIPDTFKKAYIYPKNEVTGQKGEFQVATVPTKLDSTKFNFRIYMEYGAAGESQDKTAVFTMVYRRVAFGTDLKEAPQSTLRKVISIPKDKSESCLQSDYFEIPGSELADNMLFVIERFYREVSHAQDTYSGEVALWGWKVSWEDSGLVGPSFGATFLNWPKEHNQNGTHKNLPDTTCVISQTHPNSDLTSAGYSYVKQLTEWVRMAPAVDAEDSLIPGRGAVGFADDTCFWFGLGGYTQQTQPQVVIIGLRYWWFWSPEDGWKYVGDYPPGGVIEAVAINHQTYGYVGTGFLGWPWGWYEILASFYRLLLIPEGPVWQQKANYGDGENDWETESAVIGIVTKKDSVTTHPCIGTGTYGNEQRFAYFTDEEEGPGFWTALPPLPGTGRFGAVAFTIDDKMFVGTGIDQFYSPLKDFWSLQRKLTGQNWDWVWTEVAELPGVPRGDAVAWVDADGFAHVATGYNPKGIGVLDDCWKYIPLNEETAEGDEWIAEFPFTGGARNDAVAVQTEGEPDQIKTIILTGYNLAAAQNLQDIWHLNRLYVYEKNTQEAL
jgi:hypothetical protein